MAQSVRKSTRSQDMVRTIKQAELHSMEVPPEKLDHKHCMQTLLEQKGNLHEIKTS